MAAMRRFDARRDRPRRSPYPQCTWGYVRFSAVFGGRAVQADGKVVGTPHLWIARFRANFLLYSNRKPARQAAHGSPWRTPDGKSIRPQWSNGTIIASMPLSGVPASGDVGSTIGARLQGRPLDTPPVRQESRNPTHEVPDRARPFPRRRHRGGWATDATHDHARSIRRRP
jgi:hypothetical protein